MPRAAAGEHTRTRVLTPYSPGACRNTEAKATRYVKPSSTSTASRSLRRVMGRARVPRQLEAGATPRASRHEARRKSGGGPGAKERAIAQWGARRTSTAPRTSCCGRDAGCCSAGERAARTPRRLAGATNSRAWLAKPISQRSRRRVRTREPAAGPSGTLTGLCVLHAAGATQGSRTGSLGCRPAT